MSASDRSHIYRYIFIIVLILTVYGNTLKHGFVWDDFEIIINNPLLNNLSNIPRFFISEDKIDDPTSYYRPLTYVSFSLDRAVWGLNPVGYNITNLLLHIVVSLVFYRVVAAFFKREDLAFVSALIFALHPIAGETVNFHAGGRNTLLCACFTLLSLFYYISRKHLPAIAFFTLAIFSKEFALLLPAVFLLYDRRIRTGKTDWAQYAPYLVATAVYLGMRSFVVVNGNLFKSANFSDTLWNTPGIFIRYLGNMVFPLNLKTIYEVNTQVDWFSTTVYSVLLAALIGSAIIWRNRSEILFSISLFLLFLLPVSNLFSLGTAMMADRYAYFALLGFSLGLAYAILRAGKRVVIPVMVLLCMFYGVIDVWRNGFWENETTFFTRMTKDAPEMSTGFQNLGYNYFINRDYANAERYLTDAYSKKALSGTMLRGSAFMFLEMNKPEKALAVINVMIRNEPGNPHPSFLAGRIYEQMGDKSLAGFYFDKAAALDPEVFKRIRERAVFSCRRGQELVSSKNLDAAERHLKDALSTDPGFIPAHVDIGRVYAEKSDFNASLHYFARAATLDPLNPAPHLGIAMTYEKMGKKAEASKEMDAFKELDARYRQAGKPGQL